MHIGYRDSDRVSVSLTQQLHGERFFYLLSQFKCAASAACCICGALNYSLALVLLGFVPTAGVFVTVNGFVGAMGSVGTTISGWLILREDVAVLPGRHRPVQQRAWFSDPCTQLRRRHGAARIFKSCGHGANAYGDDWANANLNWFALRGSVVPWAFCGRWADLRIVRVVEFFKSF